jgi:hypothetical protein
VPRSGRSVRLLQPVTTTSVNVGKVRAEVQVGRDLASGYRLHPPLRAVPKFRARIKRRGLDKR